MPLRALGRGGLMVKVADEATYFDCRMDVFLFQQC